MNKITQADTQQHDDTGRQSQTTFNRHDKYPFRDQLFPNRLSIHSIIRANVGSAT